MNLEKWEEVKNSVKKNFAVEAEGTEDLLVETDAGSRKQGEAEFVVFASPLGRVKLQLQKKPRVEDKKYFFSHRQGDSARVEYKFSETEFVYTLSAQKWDERLEEWKEIDAEGFTNY